MAQIPNKKLEILNFGQPVPLADNGTEVIKIPDSHLYTNFSLTLGTLTNVAVTVSGLVSGSTEPGVAAPGANVGSKEIVLIGGSTTNNEVDVKPQKNQTSTWALSTPFPGGVEVTVVNTTGGNVVLNLAVMMSGSLYSSGRNS
jgi:hypothetical protein